MIALPAVQQLQDPVFGARFESRRLITGHRRVQGRVASRLDKEPPGSGLKSNSGRIGTEVTPTSVRSPLSGNIQSQLLSARMNTANMRPTKCLQAPTW